ncbi:MAG: mechanosensitive ion channel family protein, partial [Campylobacteraceae bacterium]|nr:mechanosensitive ion channel family protein [Campylobacteraceae bacterium]
DLLTQVEAHLLVFDYLKNNIAQYRTSNFILDDLSLKYFIQSINEIPGISYITEVMHYYTKITLGEIIVAIVLIYFFIFFSKKILPYTKSKIKEQLKRKYGRKGIVSYEYLHDSISLPFTLTIYVFASQLGLSLLVDQPSILSKTTPWFNTAYLAIFTFLLYAFLKNAIHFYADNLFDKYPNVRKEMIDFLLRIGKVIVILFVLLFLFMQLGFDIQAILASLGIGGIAVALAAKDTLSNFFGSLNIITDNSFSQGDWIQAGDIEGTVVDIRMRTTRIRTFANAMITVPNAQLANTSILNWSKRRVGRRIKMSLGITYSSKMSDIQNLVLDIKDMLTHHDGIDTAKIQIDDKERKSNLLKKEDLIGVKKTLLVYIDEYDTSSINILIYCFSRSPNWETWLEVKEDVIVKLNDLVLKNNCDFAFPTQSIILNKE